MLTLDEVKIGVIGLGYVGLPLALEFGKRYPTVGFDVKKSRIAELEAGADSTLEAEPEELAAAVKLEYSSDSEVLAFVRSNPAAIGYVRAGVTLGSGVKQLLIVDR